MLWRIMQNGVPDLTAYTGHRGAFYHTKNDYLTLQRLFIEITYHPLRGMAIET